MNAPAAPAAFVRSDFSLESVLNDAGVAADRPLQLFLMNAGITIQLRKLGLIPIVHGKGISDRGIGSVAGLSCLDNAVRLMRGYYREE